MTCRMTADLDPAQARPFLKWVGGKSQLLPELLKHLRADVRGYCEPFVGGGALFFHCAPWLRTRRLPAAIADNNTQLVSSYSAVRDDVEAVIGALRSYAQRYNKSRRHAARKRVYAEIRAEQIPPAEHARVAARLIFLNRTCYNGLYRVNRRGQFNAPMGRYTNPTLCDADNLRACAAILKGVRTVAGDFEATSEYVGRGDFWYADPPYVPLSASSDFTSYTKDPFGPAEQERLAALARRLKKRGIVVLLSNSDTPLVRKLYKSGFDTRVVRARRAINSKTDRRGPVGELLIW
jgi:DNA adenine methylase